MSYEAFRLRQYTMPSSGWRQTHPLGHPTTRLQATPILMPPTCSRLPTQIAPALAGHNDGTFCCNPNEEMLIRM